MLGMHLGETFKVFLLKIFLSGWSGVKCLSTSERNLLEMLVSMLWQKGGLNQVILRFLFFFGSFQRSFNLYQNETQGLNN